VTNIIATARDFGLELSDYPLPSIVLPLDEVLAVRNDVQISAAVLNFVSNLRWGRITPRAAKADIPDVCADFDVIDFVCELSQSPNVAADLASLEPSAPGYLRTKDALIHWERLASLPAAPIPRRQKLDLKNDSELRFAVIDRLRLEGDLIDSNEKQQASDEDLRLALQVFQQRHGMMNTGTLTPETYQQLSTPIEDRLNSSDSL
jgi:murein L,D-transpeptidase YcbB/YkuD